MQRLAIRGGRPLAGETVISGSKNAVLPMLAAAVAFQEPVRISNVPELSDVEAALDILTYLGAKYQRHDKVITVDPRWIDKWEIPDQLMSRMRGSVLFTGPLMARFGVCRLTQPGGCPLGNRPVDFHRAGMIAIGAEEDPEDSRILCGPLEGGEVHLPYPSVGATENLILAAVGAFGETVIYNAAREPEIICLCDFLRTGGCEISGDGGSTVRVRGKMPRSGELAVIPDRMETATFACAAAAAGGQVQLLGADWTHLVPVLEILERTGCEIQRSLDSIRVHAGPLIAPGEITTGPYPAFPTDAQAPVMAALLRAEGTTIVNETVFDHRMNHIPGLLSMGADISCRGNQAVIQGVKMLRSGNVHATDLRGGAALAIAALAARGETQITGVHHLMRGYEDFAGKLRALGADAELA